MTLMRWTNSCFYPLACGQLVFLCVVPGKATEPARSSLPGLLPGTRSSEQLMLVVGLRKEDAPCAVSLGPESGPEEERSLCWDQPSVEHRVKGAPSSRPLEKLAVSLGFRFVSEKVLEMGRLMPPH